MNHAFDTKALELSRQAIALFFEPMPGVQLQAKIQNLFIAAMEFAAPAVQEGQPVSQPYTLSDGFLQGYKDGCEWSALMAKANHPQTGDWLYDDPLELAKAIRKGPDMLPTAPDFREIPNSSTNNCRENADSSTNGWIPCSDRLPEESTESDGGATGYLVLYTEGKEPNGGFGVGVWNVTYLRRWWRGIITHWQPLPAAPQQEVE